jgi:hypothetical protein
MEFIIDLHAGLSIEIDSMMDGGHLNFLIAAYTICRGAARKTGR